MKKILIIGKTGQVGWELQRLLQPLGQLHTLDYPQIDLTQPDIIRRKIRELKPNIIVNAAAYTAVDKAETEKELAFQINAAAPLILAEEAKKLDAYLVHYSTDYVFDGASQTPYKEHDAPNPLGVYGLSKLEGERGIASVGHPALILRTSWVYGQRGNNFLLTMLKLGSKNKQLRVVADQIGAPTWSRMVAHGTALLLNKAYAERVDGVYHMTSSGQTSWHAFATAIFRLYEMDVQVHPIPTEEYPTPAKRPKSSLLDQTKLLRDFSLKMPDWRESLELCVQERL